MKTSTPVQAIVLSKIEYKDNDAFVTVFTREQGKINIFARGVKKAKSKLGPHLQIGSVLECEIVESQSHLPILTGAKTVFTPTGFSYNDFVIFERILEITKVLCKQQQIVETVFDTLSILLPIFQQSSKKNLLELAYILKLVTLLGFFGNVKFCNTCQQKFNDDAWIEFGEHYIVCDNCRENGSYLDVSFNEIKILAFLQQESFENIEKLFLDKLHFEKVEKFIQLLKQKYLTERLNTER